MKILKFNDFINEKWSADIEPAHRIAVGIVIIFNNMILLIHPTNSSWKKSTCGIPKGKLEIGEDVLDGAIRELAEETGINISKSQLDLEPNKLDFYNKRNEVDGHLIYYVCNIEDLAEINLSTLTIPKSQLQLEEVDWGKFVSAEEAYPIMTRSQLIILDRHITK